MWTRSAGIFAETDVFLISHTFALRYCPSHVIDLLTVTIRMNKDEFFPTYTCVAPSRVLRPLRSQFMNAKRTTKSIKVKQFVRY